jgi:hypothetical protein
MQVTNKQKLSLIVLILFTIPLSSNAQLPNSNNKSHNFYLSLSSGIDNHTGLLGIGAIIPFNEKLGLRLGAGIGGWGGKFSGGIKFQNLNESGVGFGLGYSHCTGLKMFNLTIQDQSGSSRTINMDFNPVGSLNFTINKNWVLKEGMLLYLESGYAVPTGRADFYTINDGSTLNSDEELILNIMRPGGLILSLGILIGL